MRKNERRLSIKPHLASSQEGNWTSRSAFKLRRMLGENLRLGEPDASFFSLSSHKEERVGERRPFGLGSPLSGSLPARASRSAREPGFDRQFVVSLISIAYWNERGLVRSAGFPASGFGRLSSRQSLVHRTGKSRKPAGWKACPTFSTAVQAGATAPTEAIWGRIIESCSLVSSARF